MFIFFLSASLNHRVHQNRFLANSLYNSKTVSYTFLCVCFHFEVLGFFKLSASYLISNKFEYKNKYK